MKPKRKYLFRKDLFQKDRLTFVGDSIPFIDEADYFLRKHQQFMEELDTLIALLEEP